MNERAKIELQITPGHAVIGVNGEDLARQVTSLIFEAEHDGLPRLGLVFRAPDFVFEGEGIVEVVRHVDVPPAEAIAGFLGGIDPEALEEAILNSGDLATPMGVTVLQVLREWAGART